MRTDAGQTKPNDEYRPTSPTANVGLMSVTSAPKNFKTFSPTTTHGVSLSSSAVDLLSRVMNSQVHPTRKQPLGYMQYPETTPEYIPTPTDVPDTMNGYNTTATLSATTATKPAMESISNSLQLPGETDSNYAIENPADEELFVTDSLPENSESDAKDLLENVLQEEEGYETDTDGSLNDYDASEQDRFDDRPIFPVESLSDNLMNPEESNDDDFTDNIQLDSSFETTDSVDSIPGENVSNEESFSRSSATGISDLTISTETNKETVSQISPKVNNAKSINSISRLSVGTMTAKSRETEQSNRNAMKIVKGNVTDDIGEADDNRRKDKDETENIADALKLENIADTASLLDEVNSHDVRDDDYEDELGENSQKLSTENEISEKSKTQRHTDNDNLPVIDGILPGNNFEKSQFVNNQENNQFRFDKMDDEEDQQDGRPDSTANDRINEMFSQELIEGKNNLLKIEGKNEDSDRLKIGKNSSTSKFPNVIRDPLPRLSASGPGKSLEHNFHSPPFSIYNRENTPVTPIVFRNSLHFGPPPFRTQQNFIPDFNVNRLESVYRVPENKWNEQEGVNREQFFPYDPVTGRFHVLFR